MAALVGVTVVARHGARSPNWAELSPFAEAPTSPVVVQWGGAKASGTAEHRAVADNNLSDEGREQMRELGRRAARRYGASMLKGCEWHSSTAGRCEESGALFWEGVRDVGVDVAPAIHDSTDRDMMFKAWDAKDTDYKRYVDGLKAGADTWFAADAARLYERLSEIWSKVGVKTASKSKLLYWSCYGHCLLECERYHPSNKAMTRTLSREDQRLLAELARCIWERRFHRSGHADFIGGSLLALCRRPYEGFRFASCHDYSILSLLAAAGASQYDRLLAFGSHLILEHYSDGVDVWRLNPTPFEHHDSAGDEYLVEPNCDRMWRENADVVGATDAHPFLDGLLDGTLIPDRFRDYVLQDSLYLKDFAKALRLLADKSPPQHAPALRGFADGADFAEASLHESFFATWGVSTHGLTQKPTTLLYTSFLLRVVALESYARGLAALLPCFWIYAHVGRNLQARRDAIVNGQLRAPEYDSWISMYAGDAFNDAVRRYKALVDHAARAADHLERRDMARRFRTSALLEYMFWNQPLHADSHWPTFPPAGGGSGDDAADLAHGDGWVGLTFPTTP